MQLTFEEKEAIKAAKQAQNDAATRARTAEVARRLRLEKENGGQVQHHQPFSIVY